MWVGAAAMGGTPVIVEDRRRTGPETETSLISKACADGELSSGIGLPLGSFSWMLVAVDKVDTARMRRLWVLVIQQEVKEWH